MANYTYAQFEDEARKAGLWDQFSDADRRLAQNNPDAGMSLLGYKKDYTAATSEQARLLANAGANGIRKQYGGYSGGSDGGSYQLTGGTGFHSAADEQANVMLQLLEKREPYSYDAKNDPAAQNYRKQYAREGQRATRDTMGAYAAMTGGTPSTAAVTAAQQAGNYYAAQGADKEAELEQLAYSRYQNEGDQMRQTWNMYRSQADAEYGRWADEQSRLAQQEQLEYERAWQQELLEYERAQQQEQQEYERAQAEYQRKYNEAVLAAQYGDYSGLKALGINPNAYASGGYGYSSGGGGGGSSGSGTGKTNGLPDDVINELIAAYADQNIDPETFDELAGIYGEDALTAAGFKRAQEQGEDPDAKRITDAAARAKETIDAVKAALGSLSVGRGTTGSGGQNAGAANSNPEGGSETMSWEQALNYAMGRADENGAVPKQIYDALVKNYGEDQVKAVGLKRGS